MEWVKMGVTIFGLYDFLLLIIIREGGVKRERERKGRGGRDEKGRKGGRDEERLVGRKEGQTKSHKII